MEEFINFKTNVESYIEIQEKEIQFQSVMGLSVEDFTKLYLSGLVEIKNYTSIIQSCAIYGVQPTIDLLRLNEKDYKKELEKMVVETQGTFFEYYFLRHLTNLKELILEFFNFWYCENCKKYHSPRIAKYHNKINYKLTCKSIKKSEIHNKFREE